MDSCRCRRRPRYPSLPEGLLSLYQIYNIPVRRECIDLNGVDGIHHDLIGIIPVFQQSLLVASSLPRLRPRYRIVATRANFPSHGRRGDRCSHDGCRSTSLVRLILLLHRCRVSSAISNASSRLLRLRRSRPPGGGWPLRQTAGPDHACGWSVPNLRAGVRVVPWAFRAYRLTRAAATPAARQTVVPGSPRELLALWTY
jgi:hypothetical protein